MKKLFTSDKFFLAMTICAVISSLVCTVMGLSAWELSLSVLFDILIRFSCVLVLYIAYRNHSKNVMKGMMGALLLSLLQGAISDFSLFGQEEIVFSIIMLVLSAAIFVNHFISNSNRRANPHMILLNQVIAILLIITNTAWDICGICAYPNGQYVLTSILDAIGFASLAAVIVCVESRLDAYRLDREAAGWTEEAGYPEGYVHEYEKKK